MKYLLFAAAVAVASPALAQSAAAQEAPAASHAGHADHNAPATPAPSTSEHAGHAGQPGPAAGNPEGEGMKECCCCGEGEHQGHEAMMHHAEPDAEAAPAQHQHR